MIKKMRTWQRHTRLMRVARRLVREAVLEQTASPDQITTAQVACLAFGRHQLRIDEEEAAYAYLCTAQVGQEWPPAVSRLVHAQDRTFAAAAAFDERARDIAAVHDQHLYADLGHSEALAKAGYPEARAWHVGDGFGGRFTGSLKEKVAGLIEQQEAHLAKVARLSGATAGIPAF